MLLMIDCGMIEAEGMSEIWVGEVENCWQRVWNKRTSPNKRTDTAIERLSTGYQRL